VAQGVVRLICKREALISNTSPTKKKEKKADEETEVVRG
jgi:hypothetical protein